MITAAHPPAVRWTRDRALWALAAITLAGAALRFATLDARSFWYDEAITVRVMDMSFGGMLDEVPERRTPPLYYLLAWLWTRPFGSGEVGLRSLSALLGTLTIPVVFAAARQLVSTRAGLVAATLAAVSPMLVWFAQDGRVYALLVLTSGLSFLAFARALERATAGRLAAWAAASACALLTHWLAVLLVAAEAVWLFAALPARRRSVVAATASLVGVGVALLPLLAAQRQSQSWIDASSTAERFVQVPAQYLVGFQPPLQVAASLLAATAVLAALALLWRRADAHERRAAYLAGALGTAVVLAVAALDLFPGEGDVLLTRNTAAAWVPLAVAAAAGLGARRAGPAGTIALGGLVVLSLAVNVVTADDSKFEHEDWRGAAAAVGPASEPRAIVVSPPGGRVPFAVYLPAAREAGRRVAVSELVLVGLPPKYRRIGRTPTPPRPASPPPPAGMRLVERSDGDEFTLLRYRSPRAVPVPRERLERMSLAGSDPSVLFEPGR